MSRYVWGIDLAESLNYCAIIVGDVTDKIRIVDILKFNKILYPSVQALCTGELYRKFPPLKIAVDYSNNQSFSEYLEGKINPAFLAFNTIHYGKWRTVIPVKFSQQSKLDMKQTSRQLHESEMIEYPAEHLCSGEKAELVRELKEQLLREAATESAHGLSFPKPEGHDNDMAIALELMALAAKPLLRNFGGGGSQIIGIGGGDPYAIRNPKKNPAIDNVKKRFNFGGNMEIDVED